MLHLSPTTLAPDALRAWGAEKNTGLLIGFNVLLANILNGCALLREFVLVTFISRILYLNCGIKVRVESAACMAFTLEKLGSETSNFIGWKIMKLACIFSTIINTLTIGFYTQ